MNYNVNSDLLMKKLIGQYCCNCFLFFCQLANWGLSVLIFKEGGKPEKNNPLSISLHMVPLPVVNSHPPWDGSLVCSHPLSIE